jgi:hypothetical protein
LVRTKKLRKVKMQLSPESDNDQSTSPECGEHVWPDPAKIAGFQQDTSGPGQIRSFWPDLGRISGRIRSDQAGFRPFWPDPVISGRIPAILARSGRISVRIRSNQAGFRPVSVHAGFRPDSAGIRRSSPAAGFRQPAVFRWSDSDVGIIPETG